MPIGCDECRSIGDDYRFEDGELVSECDTCPINPNRLEDLRYEMMDWPEEVSGDD